MKECITHHKACDCREEATRKLVNDLLVAAGIFAPKQDYPSLHAEAVRLGYVQARSDSKPCECGCQSFVYFVAEAGIFSTSTPNECYRKDKHPQAVCSFCSRPKETAQGRSDRPDEKGVTK